MKVVTKVIPNILDKEQYILYYRSYSGNKIFTLKDISRFNITKDVFSDESCRLSVCTINTSHESLNDKVVISSIYSGSVTGADVITLSSPVYHNNEIIGDFTLNFYIDTTFLKDKKIDIYKKGHNKIISISNTGYILSSFYFVKEFIADNQTTFLYKVPFMKSVFDFIWIFFLLLLISYYSFHKISELHDKKTKLKNIESTINIDELTGAYNRKVLKDVSLQHFLEQKSTSLISIDGDNLKYINDNFGHHVGDAAIKQIVNGIRMTFRESDYFIRTGGDEFLVVLPNCELETAKLLAKKVKENVCSTVFSDHAITISVSIGVTQIRENEMIDSALKRVDELLYEDKR